MEIPFPKKPMGISYEPVDGMTQFFDERGGGGSRQGPGSLHGPLPATAIGTSARRRLAVSGWGKSWATFLEGT